jgi:hypothetical protein
MRVLGMTQRMLGTTHLQKKSKPLYHRRQNEAVDDHFDGVPVLGRSSTLRRNGCARSCTAYRGRDDGGLVCLRNVFL